MSKGSGANARHIKIKLNGDSWTIYRDHKFVARGTSEEGMTVIEESDGSMKDKTIELLIEDVTIN